MHTAQEYNQASHKVSKLLPWLVCFSASLFFFYEFIQGNMFASIADNIMQDFHVQADKMSYLSSAYYLSNVFFLLVAGVILDKYSAKNTILVAMLLCVLSTFILSHAQSFYLALFCRFITGIGSAFCFLGPIRLASCWFPPQRMAMITGVIVTIAMTGGMLAQYPLAKLVGQIGWREALMQVGWLGLGLLVLMYFGIADRKVINLATTKSKTTLLMAAKQSYLNLQNIRAALYASLMNMAIAVFGAMMGSLYLMQRLHISKEDASVINSMLFLGAILGGPIIGWVSDKLGLRLLPMKLGVILSLLILCSILYFPVSAVVMKILFLLLGFFTAAQIISYALVAESSPKTMTATAISSISIFVQGGYIIYQNLYSYLLIKHGGVQILNNIPVYSLGDYQFAASILPIGLIIALLCLFGLKETYGKSLEK